MKKLTTIAFLVFISFCLKAQNEDLLNFQQQNPEIVFISQDNFNLLTSEEIQLLGKNYILFENAIEKSFFSTISVSNKNTPTTVKSSNRSSSEDDLQIKEWKRKHIDVKIIKRSVFDNSTIEYQTIYLNNHCLILLGESITLQDILLYPY